MGHFRGQTGAALHQFQFKFRMMRSPSPDVVAMDRIGTKGNPTISCRVSIALK
jgi:hypothetical protein